MSQYTKEAKILQFNQMRGLHSGKNEFKDGELLLAGQRP
jgi:hypothetical protein